ncbi:MAG: MipA/OmpV family protein [Pseudomonadota bacterium]
MRNSRRGRTGSVFAVLWCGALVSAQAIADDEQTSHQGPFGRWWNGEFFDDVYVGMQFRFSQDPWVGEDVGFLPIPRPDRLEDYVFNDDTFSVRESLAWWRVLDPADSPFEFTFVGLFDSRRYNASRNEFLTGMDDRKLTLAGGIGAAWRGDGVFVEAWGVTDWLGRSEGHTYAASLGFPRKFFDDRLELVPHVDVIRDSSRVVDYYYGVPADETGPGRPQYTGRASNTLRLVTRSSYRFSRCWALAGRLTADFLDDAVTDSPIVDRSFVWGANVSFLRRLRCARDTAGGPAYP